MLRRCVLFTLLLTVSASLVAQNAAPLADDSALRTTVPGIAVPRLVKFSGVLDVQGESSRQVTFSVFGDQGSALWSETQTVAVSSDGKFTVTLGATQKQGIPQDIFASGEARWLEVREQGAERAQRLLMVSVPYALKAEDAERFAGRSINDFVLSESLKQEVANAVAKSITSNADAQRAPEILSNVINSGTPGVPTNFSDNSAVQVLLVQQNGSGIAIEAQAVSGPAIKASSAGTTIQAVMSGTNGNAVYGLAQASSGVVTGVRGESPSTSGKGVQGIATATSGNTIGVQGAASSITGVGVRGENFSSSGGTAVSGVASATSGASIGVHGETASTGGVAGDFQQTASSGLILRASQGAVAKFTVDTVGNVVTTGTLQAAGLNVTGTIVNFPSAQFSSNSGSQTVSATNTGSGTGMVGSNTGLSGVGVAGRAQNPSGNGIGILGEAAGAGGIAGVFNNTAGGKVLSGRNNGQEVFAVNAAGNSIVYATQSAPGVLNASLTNLPPSAIQGVATGTTAATAGVLGIASAPDGGGVIGVNTLTVGQAVGVVGVTMSANGRGVEANADATGPGQSVGVRGSSKSDNGIGVEGVAEANAPSGISYGVHGVTNTTATNDSAGVFGEASGAAVGVFGRSNGDFAAGVYGVGNTVTPGTQTVGVEGDTNSPGSFGVIGQSLNTSPGSGGIGVLGGVSDDSGIGVLGRARSTTGFTVAVLGSADSNSGVGVIGKAKSLTGATTGVRGVTLSDQGTGVAGISSTLNPNDVIASGTGVFGRFGINPDGSTNSGASNGIAISGVNGAPNGYPIAVRGQVLGANGAAFYADRPAGGNLFVGNSGGAQVFSVDGSGNVSAGSYFGNGSNLTGVVAASSADASSLGGVPASGYARNDATTIFSTPQQFNGGITLNNSEIANNTSGGHFLHSTTTELNEWIFEEGSPNWDSPSAINGSDCVVDFGVNVPNQSGACAITGTPRYFGFFENGSNAATKNYFAHNVGIGTYTPGATLDVSGNIQAYSGINVVNGNITAPAGNVNAATFTGSGAYLTGVSAAYIDGQPVSTTAPTTNQVLAFSGSQWAPTTLSGGGGISGSGTINQLAAWTGTSALGNAPIVLNGSQVALGSAVAPSASALVDINGSITESSFVARLLAIDGNASASATGQAYLRGLEINPTYDTSLGYANVIVGLQVGAGTKVGGNIAHTVVNIQSSSPIAVNGSECVVNFGIDVPNQQTSLCNSNYGFYENGANVIYNAMSHPLAIGKYVPSATLDVNGSTATTTLSVGGGGTMNKYITTSATVSGTIGTAPGCTDIPVAVTGTQLGDAVSLGIPATWMSAS